jgi:hypothetical protein
MTLLRAELPSPRYRQLLEQYRAMHARTGEPFLGIPPERTFTGLSLLPHVVRIRRLIERHGARRLLDYGSGKGWQYTSLEEELGQAREKHEICRKLLGSARSVPEFWGVERPSCYDPAYEPFAAKPVGTFDGVICTDVLEHVPEEDTEWILAELFGYAERFLFASIACVEAVKRLPDGQNAHCTVRPPAWWAERVRRAAASRASVRYEVRAGGVCLRG